VSRNKRILRIARFCLFAAILVLVARFWKTNQKMTIPEADQSMAPQFVGGSLVVVEPVDEDDAIERDIDVVYAMHRDGVSYKRFGRVRGVPGDEMGSTDGRITVNGTPIGPIALPGDALGTVPEGKLCILALNPTETRYPDSRKLGFIPRSDVVAVIRYTMSR